MIGRVRHRAPRKPCHFWTAATAAFALHALTAHPAAAQSDSTNRVLAEALFREGRDLMDHDKVPEACAKFGESYRLDRALGTLLNLALCHEKEGKTASAWSEFTDAAAEAAANKDDRAAFAQKHATALNAELARVRFVVAPATSGLASLEVHLDKNRLGKEAWSSTIPLDPGQHELAATAEGKKPYRASFVVPKVAGVTEVNVPALEDVPRVVPQAQPATAPEASSGGTQRGIGWIVAGLGVVGVGVGTAFGLSAISAKNERDDQCDAARTCTLQGKESDDRARDAATISTIGFAAGGALLVGGIVLVLTAPSSSSVRVGTSGRGLILGGTF